MSFGDFGGYTLNAPGMPKVTLHIGAYEGITLHIDGAASADEIRKLIGAASALVIGDNRAYTTEQATTEALNRWYGQRIRCECNSDECGWSGRLNETCWVGAIGPLCPQCRETVESSMR